MANGIVQLNAATGTLGDKIDAEALTVDGVPVKRNRVQVRWPLIVVVNKVNAVSWGGGGVQLFAAAARARWRVENYHQSEYLYLGLGWDDVAGDLNVTGIQVGFAATDAEWSPAKCVYSEDAPCWEGIVYLQVGEGSIIGGPERIFSAYQWNYT